MKPPCPPACSLPGRIGRLASVLLLCVALGELLVRLAATQLPGVRLLAEPLGRRAREPQSFAEFQRAFSAHLVPFRELWGFRANALGFHDVEPLASLPPGGFRVVALGDSFAYGNVPYRRGHLTVAESLLDAVRRRRAGEVEPPPFAIDNLGVPASGVADYELVYHFVGRGLRPDLVLINLYLGNDPQDFADPAHFGGVVGAPRSWLLTFLGRTRVVLAERWREGAARTDGDAPDPPGAIAGPGAPAPLADDGPQLGAPVFSDAAFADIARNELRMLVAPGSEPGLPDWDAFLEALDHLVTAVERDGTAVALVLAPSRLQVYPEELRTALERAGLDPRAADPTMPNRRVAEYAARRGVPLIDLTSSLAAARDGARLYRVNDTHWSLRGNAVAGTELALRLADAGLVPVAPRPVGAMQNASAAGG